MSEQRLPRLVRWLLFLYPTAFRREYGTALIDVLQRRRQEAGQAGLVRWRFWLRECTGLVVCALRERVHGATDYVAGQGEVAAERARVDVLDALGREVRHSLRRLLHTPVFGIAAVLTLALAIGANAAIFTLLRRVVLSPFPYASADRLVLLEHEASGALRAHGIGISIDLFLEYRARSAQLEAVALFRNGSSSVRVQSLAEQLSYTRSTPNLAEVLGHGPLLGRWLVEADAAEGAAVVAVLSHAFWQRAYGGDPAVLGRILQVDGTPVEIVGVMPAEFRFPANETEFWLPYAIPPEGRRDRGFNYDALGRLRPGRSVAQLGLELNAAIATIQSRGTEQAARLELLKVSATPISLPDQTLGTVARSLWILFGAVGMVLLIACANVANLFLVRVDSKQRELAVRRALGAGRRDVLLYFLTESLLLGLLSGGMGFLLALAGVRALLTWGPSNLPRLEQVQLDGVVALFTLVLALLSGLVLGGLPLLRRRGEASVLSESGRANTAGRARLRGRAVLATVQIALALVLLICAGLMIRSYQQLRQKPLGFQTDSRLMFGITLSERDYPTRELGTRLQQQLLARLNTLPGVVRASATTCFPLEMCWAANMFVEGRTYDRNNQAPIIWQRRVAADYFRTLGTRVVRGRDFNALDFERRTGAVMINQALADEYWRGENPIGKRVYTTDTAPDSISQWLTVTGVVENMTGESLTESRPIPQFYLPLNAPAPNTPFPHSMIHVVHSSVPPLSLLPAVRQIVAELNPDLAIIGAETIQARVARASAQMAFTMVLLLLAGGVALLLGVIGVYAVMSYSVAQRSTEMGVRIALGAAPANVVRMILREGSTVIGAGVLLGLAGALATTRALQVLLFEVRPADAPTYVAVALTLGAFALLACYIPARRAARQDPAQAMRPR